MNDEPNDAYNGNGPNRRQMILNSGILLAGISQIGSTANQPQAQQTTDAQQKQQKSPMKDLIFRTEDPRNAEPALDKLIESWITPTKHFYVRSHAPNPKIDPGEFRLAVTGMVDRPLELSLDQIRGFKQHEITATLTCAGNRRAEFNAEGKVGGVQWGAGAIGNATWTGAALSDVLEQAGVQAGARHVWFEGLDQIPKGEKIIPFGASIPIEKATDNKKDIGAMLAVAMNGQPLTADHGFPLRTVVPGYIGARSVKWLGKIVVSDRTSPNHYLATAYKVVKDTQPIDWQEAGPIYRFLTNAAIGSHEENAKLKPGRVELSGYVLPSGVVGARVDKVLLSVDGGKKWQQAELNGKDQDHCWQLWKSTIEVDMGTREIIVRAADNRGGFMPERVPWNAKGYLQNSWYRLPVAVGS